MCNGFWLGLVLLTVHLVVCGGLWLLARHGHWRWKDILFR